MNKEKFDECAKDAKENCIVSKLLNTDISMEAALGLSCKLKVQSHCCPVKIKYLFFFVVDIRFYGRFFIFSIDQAPMVEKGTV